VYFDFLYKFCLQLQPNVSSLLDRPLRERIPVLQPSRCYQRPSGRYNLSCARTWCLETQFRILFTKSIVYFDEERATFGYVVDVFLPRKLKLISENIKLVSQRKYNPFVVWPFTIDKGVGVVALKCEGIEVQSGRFWEGVCGV